MYTYYPDTDRLKSNDKYTFEYDANGNLTKKTSLGKDATVWNYEYDLLNRLVQVSKNVTDPNNPNLYTYCSNNPETLIDPTGLWHYGAEKKTEEMYDIADKDDTISGLGKEVYGSEKAATKLGKINNIKNINKIKVGQKVKLEALDGFGNDKYSQLMKNSFLMGDLSFQNLIDCKIFESNFTSKEESFAIQHLVDVEALHKEGKLNDKQYKEEIDRIGGYFYDATLVEVY